MRVVGIIIEQNKVLLLRRIKDGLEYFIFPGGGLENCETEEETLKREVKEELDLNIIKFRKIFELDSRGNKEVYFLIEEYQGSPVLGGPEKERMNESNQYFIEWKNLPEIKQMENLYPQDAVKKLFEFL